MTLLQVRTWGNWYVTTWFTSALKLWTLLVVKAFLGHSHLDIRPLLRGVFSWRVHAHSSPGGHHLEHELFPSLPAWRPDPINRNEARAVDRRAGCTSKQSYLLYIHLWVLFKNIYTKDHGQVLTVRYWPVWCLGNTHHWNCWSLSNFTLFFLTTYHIPL